MTMVYQCTECEFTGSSEDTLAEHQTSTGHSSEMLSAEELPEDADELMFSADFEDFDESFLDADASENGAVLAENDESFSGSVVCSSAKQKPFTASKKVYRCEQCVFTTKSYLMYKKHLKYHTLPVMNCPMCEFCSPYKANLERHMRNHSKKGKYRCSKCSFSANMLRSLKFHSEHHHAKYGGVRSTSGKCDGVIQADEMKLEVLDSEGVVVIRGEEISANTDSDENGNGYNGQSVSPAENVADSQAETLNADSGDENGSRSTSRAGARNQSTENQEPEDGEKRGLIRCSGLAKLFTGGSLVSITEDVLPTETDATSNNDKTSKKRPLPCLIPLSTNNVSVVDATLTDPTVNNAQTRSSILDSSSRSCSILDKLFNKKLTASNSSVGRDNISEPVSSPTKTTASLMSSSTRCPYCRQRCKTTEGLRIHKRTCLQAPCVTGKSPENEGNADNGQFANDDDIEILEEKIVLATGEQSTDAAAFRTGSRSLANGLTSSEASFASGKLSARVKCTDLVKRQVYKCPHCTFWSITASRFHVHMVGHMNARPYECSICFYRSNWRWDITKHIRLRASKDPDHLNGQVIIREESRARDYSKYDGYLKMMEVEEGLQWKPQETSPLKRRLVSSPPVLRRSSDALPGFHPRNPQPIEALYGSGLGMTPVPNSPVKANQSIGAVNVAAAPGLPRPPQFSSTVRFPVVQGVRLPILPNVTVNGHLLGGSVNPRADAPLSWRPNRIVTSTSVTPSLESLKQMDPTLAAMGLTSENTAIILPEPPPDLQTARSTPPPSISKKTTLWKCKKCPFKHRDKRSMMVHVAQHSNVDRFSCGHCGKSSNWESVIQRHCRNKHGGVVSLVKKGVTSLDRQLYTDSSTSPVINDSGDSMTCRLCPFTCHVDQEHKMWCHVQHHVPSADAPLRCRYCDFYVSTNKALAQHMILHEKSSPSHLNSNKVDSSNSRVRFERFADETEQDKSVPYRCLHCPFSSANKTQLLSHRQYHARRGQRHMCPCCSFGVFQLQHLDDHVRLHGLRVKNSTVAAESTQEQVEQRHCGGLQQNDVSVMESDCDQQNVGEQSQDVHVVLHDDDDDDKPDDDLVPRRLRGGRIWTKPPSSTPLLSDQRTRHLDAVPLVWVWRDGRFFVMFKCRHCPHVNVRRSYIESHELMHACKDPVYNRRCPHCDYVSISSPILEAHLLVHRHSLGLVYALADVHTPAERQLASIVQHDVSVQLVVEGDVATEATAVPAATSSERQPPQQRRTLFFCAKCPGRFFHQKEIAIHARFHGSDLPYACDECCYAARQGQHLRAHKNVHSREYRCRSLSLLGSYKFSPLFPPSADLTASVSGEPDRSNAPSPCPPPPPPPQLPDKLRRRFACHRCPARFVKEASLRCHVQLHNSGLPFRCNLCDYAVKSAGTLARHMAVHEVVDDGGVDEAKSMSGESGSRRASSGDSVPVSGVDLLKHKLDCQVRQQQQTVVTAAAASESAGSRYQCAICSTVVAKRDTYVRHVMQHALPSRHKCTVCDHVTKSYQVHVTHMASHGVVLPATPRATLLSNDELVASISAGDFSVDSGVTKTVYSGPPEMSSVEKQQVILDQLKEQRKRDNINKESGEAAARRWFTCDWCPYASQRRDQRDGHSLRHPGVSQPQLHGSKPVPASGWCGHCDYSCSLSYLTREHRRLHFRPPRQLHVDGFTRMQQMRVFVTELPDHSLEQLISDTAEQDEVSSLFAEVNPAVQQTLFTHNSNNVDDNSDGRDSDSGSDEEDTDNAGDDTVQVIDMATGDKVSVTDNDAATGREHTASQDKDQQATVKDCEDEVSLQDDNQVVSQEDDVGISHDDDEASIDKDNDKLPPSDDEMTNDGDGNRSPRYDVTEESDDGLIPSDMVSQSDDDAGPRSVDQESSIKDVGRLSRNNNQTTADKNGIESSQDDDQVAIDEDNNRLCQGDDSTLTDKNNEEPGDDGDEASNKDNDIRASQDDEDWKSAEGDGDLQDLHLHDLATADMDDDVGEIQEPTLGNKSGGKESQDEESAVGNNILELATSSEFNTTSLDANQPTDDDLDEVIVASDVSSVSDRFHDDEDDILMSPPRV